MSTPRHKQHLHLISITFQLVYSPSCHLQSMNRIGPFEILVDHNTRISWISVLLSTVLSVFNEMVTCIAAAPYWLVTYIKFNPAFQVSVLHFFSLSVNTLIMCNSVLLSAHGIFMEWCIWCWKMAFIFNSLWVNQLIGYQLCLELIGFVFCLNDVFPLAAVKCVCTKCFWGRRVTTGFRNITRRLIISHH